MIYNVSIDCLYEVYEDCLRYKGNMQYSNTCSFKASKLSTRLSRNVCDYMYCMFTVSNTVHILSVLCICEGIRDYSPPQICQETTTSLSPPLPLSLISILLYIDPFLHLFLLLLFPLYLSSTHFLHLSLSSSFNFIYISFPVSDCFLSI